MIIAQREILGMGAAGLKNAYRVGNKLYGGHSKYTVYDLARDLLADGYDWDEDVQIVNPDGVHSVSGALSVMVGCSLSETVSGFGYRGWVDGRQKYRPFNRDKMPNPGFTSSSG